MKKILGAAAIAAFLSVSPAAAAFINFHDQPVGFASGTLLYSGATFTSGTGQFYISGSGLDHEICPVTAAFNCESTVSVAFTSAVNNLTFLTTGYDSAATLQVSGVAGGSAFSTSFATSGALTFGIDLSSFADITSLLLSSDDPAGLAYDQFSFDTGTPGGAGGVPEPASWAMMIAGFGLVGAAMRRRSATVSASFA